MPCLDRNCRNSINMSVCTWIWSDRSVKWCHSPSLRMVKNFSIVKIFPCSISVKAHLNLTEHVIEAYPDLFSVFLDAVFMEETGE